MCQPRHLHARCIAISSASTFGRLAECVGSIARQIVTSAPPHLPQQALHHYVSVHVNLHALMLAIPRLGAVIYVASDALLRGPALLRLRHLRR